MIKCSEALKLKVGDTFYEYGYGQSAMFKVATAPVQEANQVKWTGADESGNIVDFMITEGHEHYVNLYTYPAYITKS